MVSITKFFINNNYPASGLSIGIDRIVAYINDTANLVFGEKFVDQIQDLERVSDFYQFEMFDQDPIKSAIENEDIETEMIKAYNEGLEALNLGDANYAAKKFNEVEILFPQSIWAPRAALMAAYSYYTQDYYGD